MIKNPFTDGSARIKYYLLVSVTISSYFGFASSNKTAFGVKPTKLGIEIAK
jgi:hypothetical protein